MERYDRLPKELKKLDQWVCVKSDSKAPMSAYEYKGASTTNPNDWATFEDAVIASTEGPYSYIGFVFNDNGYVGIDIDVGFEEGLMTEIGADIISKCKSYTELSKSGRGVHIILKGDLPFEGKNNLEGVEIYRKGRYFITTGKQTIYSEIIENQEAIDYVVDKYFKNARNINPKADNASDMPIYMPFWKKPSKGKIHIKPIYPEMPVGGRNLCLTSLAGQLYRGGCSVKQIYEELQVANNEACDPKLPLREIQNIVWSVTKYER